ncbi:hypothetical protein KY349_03860 [Candidatus Woesearchaeota archaeon]|nr:hypothetical protein [Candidatus Woesearchaeota archaeon]
MSEHKKHAHRTKAHHRPRKKKTNYTPYVIGALILVVVIVGIIKTILQPAPVDVDDPEQYGTVDVVFHVMSQCPYGTQVEDGFAPVLKELGENINFRLEYIASGTPGNFQSLHGAPEVEGNKIQLCVQKKHPDQLIDFVVCQNKNPSDLRGSIEKCSEETGIDAQAIIDCTDGEEGDQLLSESIKKSKAANAQGSPTMYFNGNLYSGQRDANSFKKEVCKYLEGHPACEGMPACTVDMDCAPEPGKIGICENAGEKDAKCAYQEDAAVELKIVNSEDCATCDTTQNIQVLNQIFLNLNVEVVDASTSRGKAFIENLNLQKAPSYVFSDSLEDTYSFKNNERLRNAFKKVDKYYVMLDDATGASYILDEEKRKEMEELTGVKKGDNKPQIDFYVMSYCPYGNIAEEAIEPVYQLLKEKADFNPHYVIYSNYQGGGPQYCLDEEDKYCSMHGVQELNQGLRELCVHEYMGDAAYFEFVLEMNQKCSYQNADTCWEPVAESLNLDTEKIKDCEANEWEDILSEELALNAALGVRGSPTVFVEGEAYAGARAPSGYAQSLCAGFETAPGECSSETLATLDSGTPSPAASAGGCG